VTAFVLAALLLAVLAALFLAWPLLRARPGAPSAPWAAALAVLALIIASAALYWLIGNRGWPQLTAADAGNATIASLARHQEAAPQDQEGWLSLGAAYGGIGQYALALRAYERANRLTPGGKAAALAGMGESMLLTEDSARAEQAAALFERALQLDGQSPKALFYGAIIAYRQGRLDVARARFTALLALARRCRRKSTRSTRGYIRWWMPPLRFACTSPWRRDWPASCRRMRRCLCSCARRTAARRWRRSAAMPACRRTWSCRRPTR
jgi:cytochrome c-type biogenesis protein CcmH/NrfG